MLMNLGGILGYSSNQMLLQVEPRSSGPKLQQNTFFLFPIFLGLNDKCIHKSWKIPSLRPQNSYGSYGHCLSRKQLNLPEIVSPCAQILIPWSNHRRSGREETGPRACFASSAAPKTKMTMRMVREFMLIRSNKHGNKKKMYAFIYSSSFPKDLGILKTWNQVKPAIITAWSDISTPVLGAISEWVEVCESLVMRPRFCWSRSFSTSVFFVGPVQKIWSRQSLRTWPEIQSFLVVIHLILCTSSRNGNARLKKVWVWEICRFWNIAAHWNSILKKSQGKMMAKDIQEQSCLHHFLHHSSRKYCCLHHSLRCLHDCASYCKRPNHLKKAGDLTAVLLSQFNEVQLDALQQNLEHKTVRFAEVQWIFISMVQCQ